VGGNFGYCSIVQSVDELLRQLFPLAHALSTEWQPCITYYSSPCRHDHV